MLYKIENNKVAINKTNRLIPPKRNTRNMNSGLSFQIPPATSDYRKFSFFPRTIREWNALPPETKSAESLEAFKAQVSKS